MDSTNEKVKRRRLRTSSIHQTPGALSSIPGTSSQISGSSQLFGTSSSQLSGSSSQTAESPSPLFGKTLQIPGTSSQLFESSPKTSGSSVLQMFGGSSQQSGSQTPVKLTSQTRQDSGERRTEGAHIGGQKYEMYVSTMLGTRGIDLNQNFILETNIGEKSAGNMDDVVYHLNDRTYYLQLKHSENPENNKFQPKEMLELLYNCMKSFHIITKNKKPEKCVFVIFTNRDFGPVLSKKYKICPTYIDDFILTDRNVNQVFKFKYSDNIYNFMSDCIKKDKKSGGVSTISKNTVKEFLNNIILTTCQKGRDDIKKIIIETIRKYDSVRISPKLYEQVFYNLMVYVEDWWERKLAKVDANRMCDWLKEAKTKVFESLFIEMNEQNKLIDVKFNNKELQDKKKLLNGSHLVQVSTECLEMTCTKMIQSLNVNHVQGQKNEEYICTSDATILRRRTEVLYAWQGGKWNWLFVYWNDQIHHDIENEVIRISLEKTEKIAVFITHNNIRLDGFWQISDDFNLDQLEDNSVQHLLEQPLNFQGEIVLLQELLGNNLNLKSSVTAEHVSHILSDQKPDIGRPLEKQVHYYIDRGLQSNVYFSLNILKDTSISDRFAVSGITKMQLEQLIPEGEKIGEYYGRLGKGFYKGTNQERYIVLEWTFQSLLKTVEINRPIHWLSVEGNKLKWKESHTSTIPNSFIDILNKYLETGKKDGAVDWISTNIAKLGLDNQIKNKELCINTVGEFDRRSILVIAEPGMGKTTYITKIAFDTKQSQPTSWVVRINWNEHTQFLNYIKQSGWSVENICNLLWKCVSGKETLPEHNSEKCPSLECTLFSYAENFVLFLDGFDEISPTYTDIALELIHILLQEDRIKRLFITSRPVMREKIENALNTISFGITPLTEENQYSLLLQLWDLKNDEQSTLLDNFIKEMLYEGNNYLNDKNFSTNPLHLVMLAMAFEANMEQTLASKEVCLPEQFKVLDIYKKFIERKRDIYISDKNKADRTNAGTIDAYETIWEIIEKNHMRSAMFVLFQEYLSNLHDHKIESKTKEFLRRIMEGKDRAGVVVKVVEEKPFFVHRTFAEYFAAQWFFKYYHKNREVLAEVLCEEINKVMKDMMDNMLAGENQLNSAILNREEFIIKSLLASNEVNVNDVDRGKRNALHVVVGRSIETVIPLLIQNGVSADAIDDVLQWTPAQYAIMIEDWESAGMLLNAQTREHPHPKQVVRKLRGVHINKSAPIHTACCKGYIKLIDLLVQHGADINKPITYIKETPLHVAVEMKQLEMVKWLVHHDADMDRTDQNDSTAFFATVLTGNVSIADWFLINGWGRIVLSSSGENPFHFAAISGSNEMTELLIKSNKFLFSQPDNHGQTPLHYASKYGKQKVMRCFVNHGAEVNVQDKEGRTPLHLATLERKMSSMMYLLENQATDKNIKDNEGCTPLHYAATNENHLAVKFMLEEQGTEIECRDRNGCTPLHYAAREGHLKTMELLFNSSTEKHPRDHEGRTPLHLAAEHAKFHIIKWLVENGNAEINSADNIGRTPFTIACNLDNEENKQQILQYFQFIENATLQSEDVTMEA